MKLATLLIMSSLVLTSLGKEAFYVSPEGDDTAEGSLEAPFKSVERARDAVRGLAERPSSDFTVYLRGGHYEVAETIVFTCEDSGAEDAKIIYQAYPNETPVLSAGQRVTGWVKPTEEIPRLAAEAQGKVMVAEVSGNFKALYDENGMLPRASSPPFVIPEPGGRDRVPIAPEVFKQWSNIPGLEVVVRPHHAWIVNILPVTQINRKKKSLLTSIESTYAINPLHYLPETPNCWVENSLEELDEPGEWVIDPTAGKLYFWPRNDSTVYAPRLQEIIRVEGEIDLEGAEDIPVRHLEFKGLRFCHGDRYTLTPEDKGIQHDWDMVDKDNALVRLRGAENCAVKDCHFLHSGSGAMRVDLHGVNNEISGNLIHHMGGSGITLCGYGPGTKDVNHHNVVYNNHIHHVGEIYLHSPGIMIWQSGENRVANNLIHHTNYTALIISGFMREFFGKGGRELCRSIRWHEVEGGKGVKTLEEARPYQHTHDNLIECNEIHHAMQKLGDGNGIYIRGAGAGNIIRRNYVHHLVAPMIMQCGIRTDGGQTDTIITENIIYKCTSQGVMLKLNNHFENNIIADVIAPPRGYYLSLREGPMTGRIRNNIFYSSGGVEEFVSMLGGRNTDKTEDRRGREIARIQDADADLNIYYSKEAPKSASGILSRHQRTGVDLNSSTANPLFTDPANGDFSLKPNSPALQMGFKPIDMSEIGLRKGD